MITLERLAHELCADVSDQRAKYNPRHAQREALGNDRQEHRRAAGTQQSQQRQVGLAFIERTHQPDKYAERRTQHHDDRKAFYSRDADAKQVE